MLKYIGSYWKSYSNSVWYPETKCTPATECKKRRSHKKYYDPNKLNINDIPGDLKDIGTSVLACIKNMSSLTCRIRTGSTTGTGFVQRVRRSRARKCPIKDCDDHGEVVLITVTTVTSVVKPNAAVSAEVSVYLQDSECDMKLCSVRSPTEKDEDKDKSEWCEAVFGTHDLSYFVRLDEAIRKFEDSQEKLYTAFRNRIEHKAVFVVGYPHGDKLKVSFGKLCLREKVKNFRGDQEWFEYRYDALTCAGSSGSPLLIPGQPLAGYGYWFGHPHCHNVYNDGLKLGRSSIGSEMRTEAINEEKTLSSNSLTLAIFSLLAITILTPIGLYFYY